VILLVDNYDSFTWNLVQLFASLGARVEVRRHDALDVAAARALAPDAVILGPGPGRPSEAGICPALVRELPAEVPILGICLGFQVLVAEHGGKIARDPRPVHGRASAVHHTGAGPFAALPDPFDAGRYHSLRASEADLPAELELVAWTAADRVPMAVRHRHRPRWGLQFHPDSILTPAGPALARAFLREWGLAGCHTAASAPPAHGSER